MNALRRQLISEENTNATILNRIDENSVSSTSTRPSLCSSCVSMDSLDSISSPVSQNELQPFPATTPEEAQANKEGNLDTKEQPPSVLSLELEIAKLKGKLEKKKDQVTKMRESFKLIEGYLVTQD